MVFKNEFAWEDEDEGRGEGFCLELGLRNCLGRKEGRVGFCLEFGLKNFLGRRKEGRKEGRSGFCLEFGVGCLRRKRRKKWVLSRIWCWKMLEEEEKEEKGLCLEFGV